jgi:hypothetical protein
VFVNDMVGLQAGMAPRAMACGSFFKVSSQRGCRSVPGGACNHCSAIYGMA